MRGEIAKINSQVFFVESDVDVIRIALDVGFIIQRANAVLAHTLFWKPILPILLIYSDYAMTKSCME